MRLLQWKPNRHNPQCGKIGFAVDKIKSHILKTENFAVDKESFFSRVYSCENTENFFFQIFRLKFSIIGLGPMSSKSSILRNFASSQYSYSLNKGLNRVQIILIVFFSQTLCLGFKILAGHTFKLGTRFVSQMKFMDHDFKSQIVLTDI